MFSGKRIIEMFFRKNKHKRKTKTDYVDKRKRPPSFCIYCKHPVQHGYNSHENCHNLYLHRKESIIRLVQYAIAEGTDLDILKANIERCASEGFIDSGTVRTCIAIGFEQGVDSAIADGVLTKQEETRLWQLKNFFGLTQDEVDANQKLALVTKAAIIRDLRNSVIPAVKTKVEVISGVLPFNFLKSEELVWVFQNVEYLENKSKTEYVGGTQGGSIRVARGLYIRSSSSRGERVETLHTAHVDIGLLGVTTKHIYFAGTYRAFRIPYRKIVAFDPFSDGLGVQRDAMTAKRQFFVTNDGSFTYELIANLARLSQ